MSTPVFASFPAIATKWVTRSKGDQRQAACLTFGFQSRPRCNLASTKKIQQNFLTRGQIILSLRVPTRQPSAKEMSGWGKEPVTPLRSPCDHSSVGIYTLLDKTTSPGDAGPSPASPRGRRLWSKEKVGFQAQLPRLLA